MFTVFYYIVWSFGCFPNSLTQNLIRSDDLKMLIILICGYYTRCRKVLQAGRCFIVFVCVILCLCVSFIVSMLCDIVFVCVNTGCVSLCRICVCVIVYVITCVFVRVCVSVFVCLSV